LPFDEKKGYISEYIDRKNLERIHSSRSFKVCRSGIFKTSVSSSLKEQKEQL